MIRQTSKLKLSGAYALSIIQSSTGGVLIFISALTLVLLLLFGKIFSAVGWSVASAIFFIIAVILLCMGARNRRALKTANKLRPMLETTGCVKIGHAAAKIGYSEAQIRSYIKLIRKKGYLDNIYLTRDEKQLVYCEGVFIEEEETKTEPPLEEKDDDKAYSEQLRELEALDWRITDENMAKSVRGILTISRAIFDYAEKNPEKMNQLRRFTNYYLPTVVKLLRSYDEMSRHSPKGDNIKASMKGIEGVMDGVVDTFRREHDNLYKDAALDISSDIEVLRMMMDNGLGDGKFGKM